MEWIVTIFGVSYSYANPRSICFIWLGEKYSRTDKHWGVTVIGAIDILIIFLVVNNETKIWKTMVYKTKNNNKYDKYDEL